MYTMDAFQERVYSELRHLNEKVDHMALKLETHIAALPVHYVTRSEYEQVKKDASQLRRWMFGLGVTLLASFIGPIVFNLTNKL